MESASLFSNQTLHPDHGQGILPLSHLQVDTPFLVTHIAQK